MFDFLLNILYPKRCLFCGSFGFYLCHKCNNLIHTNKIFICPVCDRPSINGTVHPRCQTRYSLDGLFSFWEYEGPVRKIIHKIKYDPFLFAAVNEIIHKNLNNPDNLHFVQFLQIKNPVLIPVPLHKNRFRYRGYNHAAVIAKAFADKWRLKIIENLLIRIKETRPQVELKGKERRNNVKDAFSLNLSLSPPIPENIIMVDDVWTTGSTLRTCAALLKRNGAHSIWALTLAR